MCATAPRANRACCPPRSPAAGRPPHQRAGSEIGGPISTRRCPSSSRSTDSKRGSSKPAGRRHAPDLPPHQVRHHPIGAAARQPQVAALRDSRIRVPSRVNRAARPLRVVEGRGRPVRSSPGQFGRVEPELDAKRQAHPERPVRPAHLVGHMARRLVAVVEPERLRWSRAPPLNLGAVTPNCIRTPPRRGRRRDSPGTLAARRGSNAAPVPPLFAASRFGWHFQNQIVQ